MCRSDIEMSPRKFALTCGCVDTDPPHFNFQRVEVITSLLLRSIEMFFSKCNVTVLAVVNAEIYQALFGSGFQHG